MEIAPAYGRDYKSAKAVREDWEAGKDFIITDIQYASQYINKEDVVNYGVKTLTVRYGQLRKVTVINIK